jgi:hypothetical protein
LVSYEGDSNDAREDTVNKVKTKVEPVVLEKSKKTELPVEDSGEGDGPAAKRQRTKL